MAASTAPAAGGDELPDARLLGKGLAVLRIFFGVIFFANGLAKLFAFRTVEVGPYRSFLINREETRGILEGEAARNDLPLIPELVTTSCCRTTDGCSWSRPSWSSASARCSSSGSRRAEPRS